MSKKQTMMKIGSSRIDTGTYFAINARNGAMTIVGKTMRESREAKSRRRSSFFSSGEVASWSFGNVERARLAPRTTRMSGTATPPDCWMARVTELLIKVPWVKKRRWRAGMEATMRAASMAQSGGFIWRRTPAQKPSQ